MTRQHLLFVTVLSLLFTTALLAQDECVTGHCPAGSTCVRDLLGGQTIDTGDVSFSVVDDMVMIQVNTHGGWEFDALHIYAGLAPVPTNGGGDVKPGRFPLSMEFDSSLTEYTHVVMLSSLGVDRSADDCLSTSVNIVVHADVLDPVTGQEETAFAEGDMEFPGRRWGWSLCLGVDCQTTDPPPPPPPPADCDPFMQTQEEFDACCAVNADDMDCAGPVA